MTELEQQALIEFVNIVRKLRRECPWDRMQTNRSIRHYTMEEVYELVEAIDEEDWKSVKGELGDLLLNVFLHAQIAEDEGKFSLAEMITEETKKMIVRHPHVFADIRADDPEQVKKNWEKIKTGEGRVSLFDGIPKTLPALALAFKIQDRAARVGFDWKDPEDVWKKVEEEIKELREAVGEGNKAKVEEELGDLLFAIVNYSRHILVHPESALREAAQKFRKRFLYIEKELAKRNISLHDATLEQMDALWNESKSKDLPNDL
ncbi:MAG: nucleoside triphosphate pyrophosphohydrolase [Candidatus Kryptoniota bacterium]